MGLSKTGFQQTRFLFVRFGNRFHFGQFLIRWLFRRGRGSAIFRSVRMSFNRSRMGFRIRFGRRCIVSGIGTCFIGQYRHILAFGCNRMVRCQGRFTFHFDISFRR